MYHFQHTQASEPLFHELDWLYHCRGWQKNPSWRHYSTHWIQTYCIRLCNISNYAINQQYIPNYNGYCYCDRYSLSYSAVYDRQYTFSLASCSQDLSSKHSNKVHAFEDRSAFRIWCIPSLMLRFQELIWLYWCKLPLWILSYLWSYMTVGVSYPLHQAPFPTSHTAAWIEEYCPKQSCICSVTPTVGNMMVSYRYYYQRSDDTCPGVLYMSIVLIV